VFRRPELSGHALAQAVTRWLHIASPLVRAQCRLRKDTCGQTVSMTGFPQALRFRLSVIVPNVSYSSSSSSSGAGKIGLIAADVPSGLSQKF
jgi:hypothetical protein